MLNIIIIKCFTEERFFNYYLVLPKLKYAKKNSISVDFILVIQLKFLYTIFVFQYKKCMPKNIF